MAEASEPSINILELDGDFCAALKLKQEGVISKGMCGDVVLTTKNSHKFVVKKFSLLEKDNITSDNTEAFFTEVKLMQSLDHSFLMKCICAGQCPEYLAICMEYYQRGTLLDYVGNTSMELSELCVAQVACGLRYLHKNNIVHLDVKLENILLDSDFNAVLGDFGLAVEMTPQQKTLTIRQCGGTPCYYAPERRGAPLSKEVDPYKMDTYCLGVVLWSLVLERFPMQSVDYYFETRRNRDLPSNIRKWLLKLLDSCPSRRSTVTDFLTSMRQEGFHRCVIDNN